MKSILQEDSHRCFLCGQQAYYIDETGRARFDPLEEHHVFGGALKSKSEKLSLKVRLHGSMCHKHGRMAVHQSRETREKIQSEAQKTAMENYGWNMEDWMREFYKNYILEAERSA